LLEPYAHNIAIGVVVVFVTYLSIVLGELFPKRLGMTFPEPIAILLARPMQILSYITLPFVWLLTITNDLLLTLLGIRKTLDSKVTEEEIKSIIKESAEGGEILDIEHNIVQRVFELGDRRVNSLYTHRSEIVFFDAEDTWETVRHKIDAEKHSAYPVCENNEIENIIGIVLLKDLFSHQTEKNFSLREVIKDPVYINENTYAYKVLELFKKARMHYGIVVDEFGSIQGIVTMDDVVDALVGDTTEIDQEEYQITQRDENSWLVDGQYSVADFLKYFDIQLEDAIDNRFTTVAGLIIHEDSVLPDVGDKFRFGDYELEIMDKDGQRIDKIMVTRKKV
jgi:putative hemolysin